MYFYIKKLIRKSAYLSVGIEAKFGVDSAHWSAFWVETLEGCRIRLIEIIDKNEKFSKTAFFEHAHQTRAQRLGLIRRHLVNFVSLEDVTALTDLILVKKNA